MNTLTQAQVITTAALDELTGEELGLDELEACVQLSGALLSASDCTAKSNQPVIAAW